MRLDRLTSKFQIAISDAQSLALGRDHQFIEPVHLMTALVNQDGGSIRPLLTLTGMDINSLRSRLGEELDRLPRVSGVEGMCSSPTASAGCSTSATNWPSSARTSSSPLNCSCWRPSTRRARWASCCALRG